MRAGLALLLLAVLSTTAAAPTAPPLEGEVGTALVSGTSTWYCDPPRWPRCTAGYPEGSMVAAAGSELQHEGWRGSWVRVSHGGRSVVVQLVDTCACRGGRVIDLYAVAFRQLAPQALGEIDVEVELDVAPRPRATLPPTDTAP